jgi:AAA+ superfamily predicted ATPase
MEIKTSSAHELIQPILADLDWLKSFLELRIKGHFEESNEIMLIPPLPVLSDDHIPYNKFVVKYQLDFAERVVLLMSMVTLLSPQIYDCFFIQNSSIGRPFSEFGGIELKSHRGFIPTAETVNFLLNGNDIIKRMDLLKIFSEEHFFSKNQVLYLEKSLDTSSFWSSRLIINEDFFYHLISGEEIKPKFSDEFPAKELTTRLTMDDLVLHQQLRDELYHILTWIKYRDEINTNDSLRRNFRAGYRALFYGPPGTGKSLTASLLGKITQHPVYRVDLSRIVSKYIGETEKNLSRLFDVAENKKWILFFDEADSLFSKRTEINDSKDKYANQGTSYLLQRLEEYDGLVILATNLRPNIDRAFVRRFQSILYFNLPSTQERIQLWENALMNINVAPETNFQRLSEKYEVSGAAISNAIQYAWLNSKRNERELITSLDLEAGLLREISKEGKSVKE